MYDTIITIGCRKGKSNQDVEAFKTGFESITRHNTREEAHNGGENTKQIIYNALENAPGYMKYVEKYGNHFTDSLADWVTKGMINVDGKSHNWSCPSIKRSLASKKMEIPENVTLGDISYLANMYYSDFYPRYITEDDCICMAHQMASDPDGYEGMAFCRWLADVMGKKIEVDWEKFL